MNCLPNAGRKLLVSSSAPETPGVLDSSAVLALMLDEPGAATVRAYLRDGVIGAANLAEVLSKLVDRGMPVHEAAEAVAILGLQVAPMTETQARVCAELRPTTRSAGLSLGDRACLALAAEMGRPAVTADRSWAGPAEAAGARIHLIR